MQPEDLQAIEKLLDRKFKENNELLRGEIRENNDSLRQEIKENNNTLRQEIKENNNTLRQEIKNDMVSMKDDIIAEIGEVFNDAFTGLESRIGNLEGKFDELTKEVEKRPTRDEMFSWADNRFTDLELAKDRHDFLHIDELDKLPAPIEISQALIERGYKQKNPVKLTK